MSEDERNLSDKRAVVVRISDTVSDENTLESKVRKSSVLLLFVNDTAKSWDVNSSIRLSSDPEVVVSQVREVVKEPDQEVKVVIGSLEVVGDVVRGSVAVRESNTSWGFQVDNVGVGVPRVGVVNKGDVGLISSPVIGSVFVQKTIERRASRSSVQPENDGIIFGGLGLRIEEPVVKSASVRGVDDSVSRVLLPQGSCQVRERCDEILLGLSRHESRAAKEAHQSSSNNNNNERG